MIWNKGSGPSIVGPLSSDGARFVQLLVVESLAARRATPRVMTQGGLVLQDDLGGGVSCGHRYQVHDEPCGSPGQLLRQAERLAAPRPAEHPGDSDRHRDAPDQERADPEERPDGPYPGGGAERFTDAVVERVLEAEIVNEQVAQAGILRKAREVGEADDDYWDDRRE
jgi:hypothetical protein